MRKLAYHESRLSRKKGLDLRTDLNLALAMIYTNRNKQASRYLRKALSTIRGVALVSRWSTYNANSGR